MLKDLNGQVTKLPFYARASLILVGIFVFITMLCLGKGIIVPLLLALMLSILFSTVVDYLVKHKMDRVFAIALTVVVAVSIGALLAIGIGSKMNLLIDAWPVLVEKFNQLQAQAVSWLSENFGVSTKKANFWINEVRSDLMNLSGERLGNTLAGVAKIGVILVLVPVYIFLILYYQPIIIDFIHRAIGTSHEKEVSIVLSQTRSVLKGYFAGLLIELVIVAALNTIGFFILGIQFALLIGLIGAILNLIPYIGGLIMLGLSMLLALLTKEDPAFALYAAMMFFGIQLIDNNFLMPKIVASKVRINALVAIVVVIAGGAMWGIAGMFLAIPLTAILKVIFDRIEALEPWGFLLGDTMPPMVRIKLQRKKAKV